MVGYSRYFQVDQRSQFFPLFGYFYIYTRNFFVHIDQTINIIYIIYSVLMIPGLTIAGPNCLPMQRIDFWANKILAGAEKIANLEECTN